MYDIDLMWHTHMALSPRGYRELTARLLGGRVLGHDDALPEAKLSEAYVKCKVGKKGGHRGPGAPRGGGIGAGRGGGGGGEEAGREAAGRRGWQQCTMCSHS